MDGNESAPRFPLPSEIADAPGAEGWRSMYPYFTRFQPDDDKRFWFYNSMHFPEPMPAFDTITAEVPYSAIGANTARVFVFPTTLGIEHRIVNGRVYITANPVTDPGEIGRRAAVFGERAGYYYENWDTLYQGWKTRIKGLIDEITSITVPELPEFDDAAVVTESRGVAQNHYVRENFHRCIDLFSVMWHHHTEFLMLGYGAYVVFFQFCKQAFPEISDQAVARMVAGIDVIMYRPDDELRGLARLAVEAGVDDLFTEGCSAGGGADRAGRARRGRPALARGVRAGPRPLVQRVHRRRLLPSPPQLGRRPDGPVRRAPPVRPAQVRDGLLADRPTEALRAERDRIASSYRDLLGSDEEKAAFDQMLGLCRVVFPYVEDHKFYCEHWFTIAVLRQDPRVRRAAGQVRGARRGRGRVPAAPHRGRPGAVRRHAGLGRGRRAAGRGPLRAHHRRAQADARGAAGLVAAARARPGARGAERPGRAHAVGRDRADDRDLGGGRD